MANVDVRCPFGEQTASVKNTVMAKVPISVTVVNNYGNSLSSSIIPIVPANRE
ncbi:MAG: hypothetical protein ACR5LF_00385 [Symbiopectobacterium sp.]